ncbi:2EXR family [Microdochium nivale]|nr:2EXR family [Microdochium nivale]
MMPATTAAQPRRNRDRDTPVPVATRATEELCELQGAIESPQWQPRDRAASAGRANPDPGGTSITSNAAVSSQIFTCFTKLPSELRALVWREAYLELLALQPCVCIYQGGTLFTDDISDMDKAGKPVIGGHVARGLRYNHATPVVHAESAQLESVCREARLVCVGQRGKMTKASRVRPPASSDDGSQQHSGQGTPAPVLKQPSPLPTRLFDPAIDVLYIDRRKRHGDGSAIVFYLGDRTSWVRHVRHIAFPFSLVLDIARRPALLRHLSSLEKISLVFPATERTRTQDHPPSGPEQLVSSVVTLWSSIMLPTSTPSQRVGLRALGHREMAALRIKDDLRCPPSTFAEQRSWPLDGETGRNFVELVKSSIGNRIRRTDQYSLDLQKFYWNADGTFKFVVEGCVFKERQSEGVFCLAAREWRAGG